MSHHNNICRKCYEDKYGNECHCNDGLREDIRYCPRKFTTVFSKRVDKPSALIRRLRQRGQEGNSSEIEKE